DRRQPGDLLERQDLVAPQPLEAFRRHAVRAPEVAFVGDGDPHRADPPSPAVDERFHAPSVPAFGLMRYASLGRRFAQRSCRNTAKTTPPRMEVHMVDLRWETGGGQGDDDDGGSGGPPPDTGGDND